MRRIGTKAVVPLSIERVIARLCHADDCVIPYTARKRSCISRRHMAITHGDQEQGLKRWSPCSAARVFSAATWCARWPTAATASASRCAGRNSAGYLRPMGRVGQIQAVQANLRYPDSVAAAVRDADIVVNLVGILFERGNQRFDAVMAAGAEDGGASRRRRRRAAGSCFGHRRGSRMPPRITRARRGRAKRACWPRRATTIIMRPSIVFGPEDDFFNRFAALARLAPALPLRRRRPHPHAAGVCRRRRRGHRQSGRSAMLKPGAIYEFGGPDVRTFKELMEFVLATTSAAACWCRCRSRC